MIVLILSDLLYDDKVEFAMFKDRTTDLYGVKNGD